ncbi:hypothetical protein [Mucilaginibacter psychrotolerans]|nr:hypothetical protein [Mucilaginibacter psychrotolerans]
MMINLEGKQLINCQGMPQALLPEELEDTHVLAIWRFVNGYFSNASI